jgi:hypothetical protein
MNERFCSESYLAVHSNQRSIDPTPGTNPNVAAKAYQIKHSPVIGRQVC